LAEPNDPASPSSTPGSTQSAGPSGARAQDIATGPARVSLGATAGDSFTLHAARLPVVVAFQIGERCPGQAVLMLDQKPKARGDGRVSVAVPSGSHAYALRCVQPDGAIADAAVANGTIMALRDPGTAELPRRAPSSFVDADGKHYMVLYQNLLPRITFAWPSAPKSNRYVIRVESGAKTVTFGSDRASYAFAAGALREGTHTLTFSTPAGERSKPTELEIRFDNAAPKASVSKPKEGSFSPGQQVEVEGVALPGFTVTLPGGNLQLDKQSRFSGSVSTSAEQPDVVLRIESPRGGVHYFVRHAAGAP